MRKKAQTAFPNSATHPEGLPFLPCLLPAMTTIFKPQAAQLRSILFLLECAYSKQFQIGRFINFSCHLMPKERKHIWKELGLIQAALSLSNYEQHLMKGSTVVKAIKYCP